MLKIFFSFIMMTISLSMLFLTHPISMGLMILIQTLVMCLLMGMMIKTYWFSYILFLIFLGGLLVLFIYVSSIASNEMFNFSMKNWMFILTMMILLLMIMMNYLNNLKWMNLSNNMSENDNFYLMNMFNNNNKINLNKMYNNHNFMILMMLVIYLFIALVAVVKITNIFFGPLRQMK